MPTRAGYSWRTCTISGLVLLVLAAITFPQFPQSGYDISPGYGSPVYAFEMARSPADLERIFGPVGDPDRERRVAAMDSGNLWDYPFMLAYGLFIWTFFLAVANLTRRPRWRLFGALGLLAAGFDAFENQVLLELTPELDSVGLLALLPYPVWLKFGALLLAAIGLAAFLWTTGTLLWQVAALVVWVGCAAGLLAMYSPADFSYLLGLGIGLTWVLQLAYALGQVLSFNG